MTAAPDHLIPGLASHLVEELDSFLVELNRAASGVILPLFRADHGLVDKGGADGFDPVTDADKGAERAIRALIAERYPEHGVIGEEYGEDRANAEFVWVLDPVDGTRAFIAGLPLWCTLIGLRFQGKPVLGSIGQSYLGELYIGHAGGSRLIAGGQSRPLKVRACSKLSNAIIATTDPALFQGRERDAWRAVRSASRLARLGCDAYAYAMVAAGTIDLVLEARLKSWDIEAAIPVVAGAGGFTTDWRGEPLGDNGGQVAIAGDRACLDEAVAALNAAAP
ncbi:histidinol-phosphatase [Phenylobacterium sp.]|jgi:histidinol phosphatase-like enzyme (inositol monophosphatase family)|uniref:histidinol-phosphatase n=1 Tax=Phenylobacterium sp. TaxID=1871053 RepID=UPI002F3E8F6E